MKSTTDNILFTGMVLAGVFIGTGCVSRTTPADITKVSPIPRQADLLHHKKGGGNQVKAAQHQSSKIKTQRQESQEFRRESLIEKTRRILELEKQGLLSKKEAEALIRRAVNDAVH